MGYSRSSPERSCGLGNVNPDVSAQHVAYSLDFLLILIVWSSALQLFLLKLSRAMGVAPLVECSIRMQAPGSIPSTV